MNVYGEFSSKRLGKWLLIRFRILLCVYFHWNNLHVLQPLPVTIKRNYVQRQGLLKIGLNTNLIVYKMHLSHAREIKTCRKTSLYIIFKISRFLMHFWEVGLKFWQNCHIKTWQNMRKIFFFERIGVKIEFNFTFINLVIFYLHWHF